MAPSYLESHDRRSFSVCCKIPSCQIAEASRFQMQIPGAFRMSYPQSFDSFQDIIKPYPRSTRNHALPHIVRDSLLRFQDAPIRAMFGFDPVKVVNLIESVLRSWRERSGSGLLNMLH